VGDDGQNGELRIALGRGHVVDDGHRRRPDDEGREDVARRTQLDRLAAPPGHRFGRGHDQDACRALEARAEAYDVDGPGQALLGIGRKLDLNDDAEHGLSVDEQHDQVRAVLGRLDLRQVGRLDPRHRVRRQLDVQCVAQELRGELGPVAKQQQQGLVLERGHRATPR
jgi:hypothetical protein